MVYCIMAYSLCRVISVITLFRHIADVATVFMQKLLLVVFQEKEVAVK